jgi:hypothetical protein
VVNCPFVAWRTYHIVTRVRRASGKLDKDATVQTYRHYLLDARFGVLLEGSMSLLEEVAAALRNPLIFQYGSNCLTERRNGPKRLNGAAVVEAAPKQ